MKLNFRFPFLLIAFLLSISSFFSCQDKTNDPAPPREKESLFVKAVFNYADGTHEPTRIMDISYDRATGDRFRTTANIRIDSKVTLTEGNYGVAEFFDGADVTIAGQVTFGNLNPNNSHAISIRIEKGAQLTISSSLNQNGKFVFNNYGTLITGNHEMQSGKNEFNNYGTHTVNGDLQISSGDSQYNNCGTLTVSNYTNFHSGRYSACNCGQLITNGLNVNGSYKVEGKGFIKVTGNLNLNGFLTDSPDIEFCYTGHINQPDKIGKAKRTCEPTCKPDGLPVRYTNLKAATSKNSEGKVLAELGFDVTESTGLSDMQILTSSDGKNWKVSYTEKDINAFVPGKRYTVHFQI